MTRRGLWAVAGAAGLVVSIAALAWLFLSSVDRAAAHFHRAAQSQAQFAQALAIRDAARAGDAARLARGLAAYRASITAEARLMPAADRPAQARERVDADRLARLAASPARHGALDVLVDRIARREQAEAAETAAHVATLRRNARFYALLLAAGAALSAALGGVGLLSANRRLSRAVAARTAQIAAIDAARRLFFAKVSHELRTPVTIMRGEAEVALSTAPDDPRALSAALGEVVAQSELLDRRVEELLALSQAEDGRLTLASEPFDLAALARSAAERTRRHAASNGVTLAVDAAVPLPMRGDARWLEQAMIAVLDNAIKFSPEGTRVEVGVARAAGDRVEVSIADRGAGVPAEALPRLFDAYYQTAEGRAHGGNGLGLALSRWVVEQHGGTARAARRDGGGCRVVLDLPLTAAGGAA